MNDYVSCAMKITCLARGREFASAIGSTVHARLTSLCWTGSLSPAINSETGVKAGTDVAAAAEHRKHILWFCQCSDLGLKCISLGSSRTIRSLGFMKRKALKHIWHHIYQIFSHHTNTKVKVLSSYMSASTSH